MAEKACHVVGSATQVGLTQALGPGTGMNAAHIAVLAILPAIALSWLYVFELCRFTRGLRGSAPDLWRALGSPTSGEAGTRFLIALARGSLSAEP